MKKIFSILLLSILFQYSYASTAIDSLNNLIANSDDDYEKSVWLLELSNRCDVNDIEKYANPLIELCDKLLEDEKSPDKIYLIKSDKAEAYNNLGYMFKIQGIPSKAIENLYLSIDLSEQIKDSTGMANTYNNLGSAYQQQSDAESAKNFFLKSLDIYKKINDKEGVAITYNNLGYQYELEKNYKKSFFYHDKSIALWEELESPIYKAYSLNNIGVNLDHMGLRDSALNNFFEALKIFEAYGNDEDIAWTFNLIGGLYIDQHKINEAKNYLEQGLELANTLKIAETKRDILKNLYVLYAYQKEYEKAFNYHKQFVELDNKIKNNETQKLALKKQLTNKYEKQKERREFEHNLQLEKEENQRFSLYIGVAFLIIFLGFMYNRFRVTKKQKLVIEEAHHELGEKNQEIMDSITYAKRIQNAILPTDKIVKEHLPSSFILYKPKDIVAGDFYWMESVAPTSKNKSAKVLFAAADCTGHGVPGAMVSVVCNNALNRCVREHNLTDPAQILDKTREIVVEEFEKSDEEVKDGMDIALCSLEGTTLKYAGAHNPLWIIRNGEIIETKADKQPIGKFIQPLPYTTHTFELQEGDSIYIFSDGYVDQFGGEKGKKFKAKAFRELLLTVQANTMEEQKTTLNNTFESWKGDLEQIDDVCVIGLKI